MTVAELGLHEEIDEMLPAVIADRRFLHQHPELAFQEHETAKFVAERLAALGVEDIRTGIGQTGVTGIVRGTASSGSSTGTIMLRADMDALPILEENDVEYRSTKDGVMHACGHDSHVSMLLGVTRMLVQHRDRFSGDVKVLFQPAEEGGGGALAMINDGVLEDPHVEATFGIHIWQHADLGSGRGPGQHRHGRSRWFHDHHSGSGWSWCQTATLCRSDCDGINRHHRVANARFAGERSDAAGSGDDWVVQSGKCCECDSGCRRSQRNDPHGFGGTAWRTQSESTHPRDRDCGRNGRNGRHHFGQGAPPTVNDPAMAEVVRRAARQVVGPDQVVDGPLKVVSEDYSEFLARVPGCYYFIGSRNSERGLVWGHHHPRFDIDEESMAIGIETMTRTVIEYFNQ